MARRGTGSRLCRAGTTAIVVAAALVAAGCGTSSVTDPADAGTCEELAEASVAVAAEVLDRLEGQTFEELETANPDDPFLPIREIQRPDDFEAQARVLGCSDDELLDCEAFAALEELAEGEAAAEYLRPYRLVCD